MDDCLYMPEAKSIRDSLVYSDIVRRSGRIALGFTVGFATALVISACAREVFYDKSVQKQDSSGFLKSSMFAGAVLLSGAALHFVATRDPIENGPISFAPALKLGMLAGYVLFQALAWKTKQ